MTVARFIDPVEASLAKNCLEEAGFEAFLADAETVSVAWQLSNALGGIKLQVAEPDAAQARIVLREQLDGSAGDQEELIREAIASSPHPAKEAKTFRPRMTGRMNPSRSRRVARRTQSGPSGRRLRAALLPIAVLCVVLAAEGPVLVGDPGREGEGARPRRRGDQRAIPADPARVRGGRHVGVLANRSSGSPRSSTTSSWIAATGTFGDGGDGGLRRPFEPNDSPGEQVIPRGFGNGGGYQPQAVRRGILRNSRPISSSFGAGSPIFN